MAKMEGLAGRTEPNKPSSSLHSITRDAAKQRESCRDWRWEETLLKEEKTAVTIAIYEKI